MGLGGSIFRDFYNKRMRAYLTSALTSLVVSGNKVFVQLIAQFSNRMSTHFLSIEKNWQWLASYKLHAVYSAAVCNLKNGQLLPSSMRILKILIFCQLPCLYPRYFLVA